MKNMKFAKTRNRMILALLLCPLLGLGCTKFGKSRPQSQAALSVENPAPGTINPSSLSSDGTSTSGGANGIDGKVYDSYIVDPVRLPAFQEHLAEVFQDDDKLTSPLFVGAHLRTWYIAPVELETIEKGVLGISFVKSGTEQIAIQTMNEIWINKKMFDAMSSREQADVITHEIVMSLYLLKFMPFAKFCEAGLMSSSESLNESCKEDVKLLDEMFPVEPSRSLNEEDNQRIRRVTGWLLKNSSQRPQNSEFVSYLLANGFNGKVRIFGSSDEDSLPYLPVTGTTFFDSLNAAQLTGQMPNVCAGLGLKESKPCKITFEQINKKNEIELPYISMKIQIDNQTRVLKTHDLKEGQIDLIPLELEDGSILYYHFLIEARSNYKVGDTFTNAIVLFKKDKQLLDQLVLHSILIKPGILTSVEKKDGTACPGRPPQAHHLIDDQLVARQTGAQSISWENILIQTPPILACF